MTPIQINSNWTSQSSKQLCKLKRLHWLGSKLFPLAHSIPLSQTGYKSYILSYAWLYFGYNWLYFELSLSQKGL